MDGNYSTGSGSGTGSDNNGRPASEMSSRRRIVPLYYERPRQEEWKTSRKITNHTTKQVETRVKRQIILEDGKVISDSGPQITTKTIENTTTEDDESTEHKTDDFVAEKSSTRLKSYRTKDALAEMEDDPWMQLTADAYHHLSVISPDTPRGRLTNYNSHSRTVTDRDVERSITTKVDGELNTETTTTHHHEEIEDDEVPEDETNRITIPEASVESFRTFESVNEQPSDLIETSKTRAGGNVINIQMSTNRKQAPSSVIYVRNNHINKSVQVGQPHTEDRQTQTPPVRISKRHTDGVFRRFVTALDKHLDDKEHYQTPPPTPPRLILPYRTNPYNSSSSATPPDSPLNSVSHDYRRWPLETRKWHSSDGTVIVEVRQPERRHY